MNEPRLSPDDPQLTAYALGELSGDERAEVEAALRQDPALRAAVEEIRATAAHIEAALAAESAAADTTSAPVLNGHAVEFARVNGAPEAEEREDDDSGEFATAQDRTDSARFERGYATGGRGRVVRFPQFYFVIAGLAAACFAVLLAVHRDEYATRTEARETLARIAHKQKQVADAKTAADTGRTVRVQIPLTTVVDERVALGGGILPRVEPALDTGAREPLLQDGLSLLDHARLVTRTPSSADSRAPVEPTAAAPAAGAGGGVTPTAYAVSTQPIPDFDQRPNQATTAASASPADTVVASATPNVAAVDATTPPAEPAPVQVTAAPAFPGAAVPPDSIARSGMGGSDVVLLQPFAVTATRDTGYAAIAHASSFGANIPDRELSHLPRPPLGARFGYNTEAYAHVRDNPFIWATRERYSTFAVEVDTASYANIRRMIERGTPPPRDAVRIEELLNYFPYRYAAPRGSEPFAAALEVAEAPWAPQHRLVRIGLKGREVTTAERPAANLVFLIDVSGSMDEPNKLPLVKESMRLLVGKLRPDDRVAIVTYAGNSGLALPSTPVSKTREILAALDTLTPGGSTNGAMGIRLAYEIATTNLASEGINRVILCTDGDFNVGVTSEGELVRLIEEKAQTGVALTVLGFGMGNYKDSTLEKLAAKGKGSYGYIDTRREAEKLLVEQVSGTLVTIAKDVKIQVEFNPAKVASYRLIGYENRLLNRDEFSDDKVDAGEIGAGHTLTALYEVVPVGVKSSANPRTPPVDETRYGTDDAFSSRLAMPGANAASNELLTVRVRYKKPNALLPISRSQEFPVTDHGTKFASATPDFRFAAAVAQFGMILRNSPHKGGGTLADVMAWAGDVLKPADDPGGYRHEFLDLVRKTQVLLQ